MPEVNFQHDPDRYFSTEPNRRRIARELYDSVAALPIVSPHGHVDPGLFVQEDATFGSPANLLIIPDHYVFRMLYSQGISLKALGIRPLDGSPPEQDHRKIWQLFAENFYLFRGTPTGSWITQSLAEIFGIQQRLDGATGPAIYDQIAEKLASFEFRPRALFKRFNIETLCTTDAAGDTLEAHQAIRASGWSGDIRPTFRPDSVTNLLAPGWNHHVDQLSSASGVEVVSYPTFVQALEQQRQYFRSLGATATDHGVVTPYTEELPAGEANAIFQRALHGWATPDDAARFTAHMLVEFARMSIEDGLVMQLHPGSIRNHNQQVAERFGPDMGCDIPECTEFTHNLRHLLNKYGNDSRLTLILFTLDETTYGRELAPLAGHYPAIKLGPPWWFFDSLQGMERYFDQVMETAGLYNTVGFNDDTRAFTSIPVRHDVWRRASANWVAGLVARGIVGRAEAEEMIADLAYHLAKKGYKLALQEFL
jgi:glucuronate isomerase